MTTWVSWSGGADSTALLWKLLNEGTDIKVRHCDFRMKHSRRWEAENHATEAILAELSALGHHPDFATLTIDLRGCGQRVTDIALATSMIAPQMRPGDVLARGSAAHDFEGSRGPEVQGRRELTFRVLDAITRRKHETVFPIEAMARTELWALMPESIRWLTISCRTPTVADGRWVQCGKCHACESILAQGLPLERRLAATP